MALLLVFGPLARLVLIRVAVDSVIHSLGHLLLPALRDHQRKVLIELLITVKQLRHTKMTMTFNSDSLFRSTWAVLARVSCNVDQTFCWKSNSGNKGEIYKVHSIMENSCRF